MANYSFAQLVDLAQVNQLLESHHRLSGMAYGLQDSDGKDLVIVGWQDICTRFHRVHPVSCAACLESNAYIKSHLHDPDHAFVEYRCGNDMIDIAMPIVIEGRHLATFFTGHFFFESAPPDTAAFVARARALEFDEDAYLHALARVPTFSREYVHGQLVFLHQIVRILAETGLKNLQLHREMAQRKLAELAVRESEQKYRCIVDTASEGIWALGPDTRSDFVNARMCELLGYESGEILGRPLSDFLFKEDVPDHLRKMESRRHGESEHYERRFLRKDGETLWTFVNASPIVDEHHRFLGSFAMITDITERKKAERLLHQVNRELRAISNCNQVLMRVEDEQVLLDEICRIICEEAGYLFAWVGLAANDEAKAIHPVAWAGHEAGYLAEARLTWADTERGKGPVGRTVRTGLSVCFQDLATEPDFAPWRESALQRGYRSLLALPLMDGGPRPFGVLSIYSTEPNAFTDEEIRLLEELAGDLAFGLTVLRSRVEHQKAEREREQFHKFFLTSADVMCLADPQGVFLKANPSCQEVLGYPESELVTKPFADFIHPEDRQKTLDEMADQMKRGHSLTFENRCLCKDGSCKWLSWRASHDKAEGITYVTGRDITEQKRAEEQLRQSQKMDAIGQLAGGVAHDFNNILTAIIGFGQLAKMEMESEDPHHIFFDQILASANRAAQLTRGLLAFSRKQVLLRHPVSVNAIVKNVESLLRRLIGEDIELSIKLSDENLIVMADAGQIEQVLMNLATNARDAMPCGGTLTITTEAKMLGNDLLDSHGFGNAGKYCLVTVSDSGLGMDKATRARIFEPFFTTKERGKGTGLGLSIAYGIVKQHDGTTNVYSELGKGTTFRIYLPLIAVAVEEVHPERNTRPVGGTETILLAEDDTDVRNLTATVLRNFGYHVIEAVDGLDALGQYEAHANDIALLILDVIMPKMSGRDAYDVLHALNPGMKVLFISGYAADALSAKEPFADGTHYVAKPMSPVELLQKVRAILNA